MELNERQRRIVEWAHSRISNPAEWVILDTETTHLEGEVIELVILDPTGRLLLESLVRPVGKVLDEARVVHGISDEELAAAPAFSDLWPRIYDVLSQVKYVITYNAAFDRERLAYSAQLADLALYMGRGAARRAKLYGPAARPATPVVLAAEWECLMEQYARYHGERSRRGFKYQALEKACRQLHVRHEQWHRARGDAHAALKVLKSLAGKYHQKIGG
jgi:DNA polymerase III epsilon subunit-like protein